MSDALLAEIGQLLRQALALIPPPDNDIVDASGTVIQSAYNAMAYNYSDPESGLKYRFGEPATKTGVHTLPQRPDIDSILYGSQERIYYQFGGPPNEENNDFVSSHGAAVFRPATGTSIADAVGRFCTYQIDRHTISQRPQLMWNSPQLLPPQVEDYISQGILDVNEPADLPVIQHRQAGPADSGATRMSLVATQGSPTRGARIFTVGTETAQQRGSCILDIGKVPTAMSVTSGGEFCFVSVWDTVNFKGQVAVIALGSVPAGCTWQDTSNWYDWWHDFSDMTHPGFKNQGGWAFLKVIGYVDLPANMKAPTCIHAYTGMHPYEAVYDANGQISGMGKEATPMANNRARLLDMNDLGKWYAKGGSLVVGSQSEKTVCFLDLAPLFTYFNDMYLGSQASNLETQNLGMAANQWPYMLADVPQAMPTIIKTFTLAEGPVGIASPVAYNYWSKDWQRREPGTPYWIPAPRYPRVWVVTRTGTCHVYSMGRWVPGSKAADQAPEAFEIAEIGTITGLGENITHVAGVKDYDVDPQGVVYDQPGDIPGCLDEMMMVVDRKNRRINWVQFTVTTGDGGSIVGSLEDSRMDPIAADHVDGYYRSNKVILVADGSGHCVRTYRARTTEPLTYDGTAYPTLDVGGEYGGSYPVPVIAFSVGTSNAP